MVLLCEYHNIDTPPVLEDATLRETSPTMDYVHEDDVFSPRPDSEDIDESENDLTISDTPNSDINVSNHIISKPCSAKSSSSSPTRSNKSKKRVQFLPDGALVRIRMIPPRSNKSSSSSDGSASESEEDSDASDSETATDSEVSDRDTPSPAVPTESTNKFTTMPPLLYAAKGSYNVSKASNKNGLLVAKITGINRPSSPSQSQQSSAKGKKQKRQGSPKNERGSGGGGGNGAKKAGNKVNDKEDNGKKSPDNNNNSGNNKTKGRKKRIQLKVKEGKISPPPPTSKSNKNTANTLKAPVKLSQRRGSNSTNNPIKSHHSSIANNKRSSCNSVTSTSVKSLQNAKVSPSTHSSSSPTDISIDRVSRAMQSLSMGKLYTVDGFIFPQHHANELHLPDVTLTSKSEDFDSRTSLGGNVNYINGIISPRRNLQIQSNNTHQNMNHRNLSYNSNQHPNTSSPSSHHYPHQQHQQQQSQIISPSSANRKRRHYAWQMANGSIQNTLASTPNISQLWDNISVPTDAMDKVTLSNHHKQMT